MFHIIPQDDHNQALRIKRFLMAFGSYVMWMMLIFYCYSLGLLRLSLAWTGAVASIVLIVNIILFAIIRSGLNSRFKDPSLTETQMIIGTLVAMTMTYYLNQARGIMLINYMVVFIFGIFRLNLRQFCALSIFAVLGYGFIIALLHANYPHTINIRVELIYLVTLGSVLVWFSFMGSYMNVLRKKLSIANSELNSAMQLIKQQAIHDDLTGVYNRGYLFQILKREKALADRENCLFSVCIFDLDDFKKVNDTYGHYCGDIVLKTITGHIKENIRQQDYIARYGGEEFVLILAYPNITDALTCAERIRKMVSEIVFPGLPEDFRVSVSMGLTRYQPGESIDTLMVRADDALYRAKRSGKNTISHDPLSCAEPAVHPCSAI